MKAIYGLFLCVLFTTQVFAHSIQPDTSGNGKRNSKGNVEYGWKVEAGESFSSMSISDVSSRTTLSPKLSFLGGVSFIADDFRVGRLVIAVQYKEGGLKVTTKGVDDGLIMLRYLNIPVQYHFYVGRSKRLFAGGGGYIAPLLSHSTEQLSLNFEKYKNYDAGALLTAGYRLTPRILLEGGVQRGFVNVDASEARRSSRNGMAFLLLSFTMGSSTSGHMKKAQLTCRKSTEKDY